MIKLNVMGFCHDCPYFEPEVNEGDRYFLYSGNEVLTDKEIKCSSDSKCKRILEYLSEKELKENG